MKRWFTTLFTIALISWQGLVSAQTVVASYDFSGDMQGWTSNAISLDSSWKWTASGRSEGLLGGGVINSPTQLNGSVIFDADLYTTKGTTTPTQPYPRYLCELISPDIDLSAQNQPISLSFYQTMRPLNLSGGDFRTSVSYSIDGGTTWSAQIDCNPGVPVNATGADIPNGQRVIPIPGVSGQSQVKIKFTFAMDFYYWVIDDVQLILRQGLDMRSNGNFYAIPHNAQTPASQVIDMGFLNDIENVGGSVAENVNLNISITDGLGNQVYTEDLAYGNIGLDSIAENVPFPGRYTPAGTVGSYTGTYTVSADGTDANLSDNTNSFGFEITNNLFAKDLGATRSVAPADDNSFTYGNHYRCTGAGWKADKVYFGLTFFDEERGAAASKSVTIWLYEWTDENKDGNAQSSELTERGFTIYDITGVENYRNDPLIEVQLEPWDLPTDLNLIEGKDYIVALQYDDTSGEPVVCFYAAADNLDYSAMAFLQDSVNDIRNAGMLDVGNTGELGRIGFGRDIVPVVQLSIQDNTATNDIELGENALTLFPNPASDIMNVQVSLDEIADEATFTIYSADGRQIFTNTKENIQKTTIEYNVSTLPNGNYLMHMQIDGAYKMQNFTVAK